MREYRKEKLTLCVLEDRGQMGQAAADFAEKRILEALKTKDEINMIFAAAPSQNETLAALAAKKTIPWNRINAFHMDEYDGFSKEKEQSFGTYLKRHIFDLVPFKSVWFIADHGLDYAKVLRDHPVDIICLGIGENGHIAFNDPGVADFHDPLLIKRVALDEVCRTQQVHDGCFPTLDDVPTHALTVTVPAMFAAATLVCTVPGVTKAEAVKRTMTEDIGEQCPATIMRLHSDAVMFCDENAAALFEKERRS